MDEESADKPASGCHASDRSSAVAIGSVAAAERVMTPNPDRATTPVKLLVPVDREDFVTESFENAFPPADGVFAAGHEAASGSSIVHMLGDDGIQAAKAQLAREAVLPRESRQGPGERCRAHFVAGAHVRDTLPSRCGP
jgi:hypothetical protein